MEKIKCVFLITIIALACLVDQIISAKFPEFFDEEDLKSLGVKNAKQRVSFHSPPVTREPDYHPPGYHPVEASEMYQQRIIPPNGLPIHESSPTYKNRQFTPLGRGDPTNQNIVQQMDEEDTNAIFPNPDGKSVGGHDFIDLVNLENRLTQTNKWDEFKALVAEENENYKDGEVMENWEDDAHMWAAYSRQLLAREKGEKQRAAEKAKQEEERRAARQNFKPKDINPSIGMEPYWMGAEKPTPTPSNQSSSTKELLRAAAAGLTPKDDAIAEEMRATLRQLPSALGQKGERSLEEFARGIGEGGIGAFPKGLDDVGPQKFLRDQVQLSGDAGEGDGRDPGRIGKNMGPEEYAQGARTYPQIPGVDLRGPGTYPRGPGAYPRRPWSYPKVPRTYPRGQGPYPRGPGTYPRGQDTYPKGPGTYPRGPDTYLRGPDTYPKGLDTYPRGPDTYFRGPDTYPRSPDSYPRGPDTYPRGPDTYPSGPDTYPRGPGTYPRGPGTYTRGPGMYPRGAGTIPRGAGAYPKGPEAYHRGPKGFPRNPRGFSGRPAVYPRGPEAYVRGPEVFSGESAKHEGVEVHPEISGFGSGTDQRLNDDSPDSGWGTEANPHAGWLQSEGQSPRESPNPELAPGWNLVEMHGPPAPPGWEESHPSTTVSSPELHPGPELNEAPRDSRARNKKYHGSFWKKLKSGVHLPMDPPRLWTRRQYGDIERQLEADHIIGNGFNDNFKQPRLFPMYNRERPYRPNDLRDKIPTGRDDRYLPPEQRSDESPNYDMSPEISPHNRPFRRPRIAFDENVNEDDIPRGNGKILGPGSEADFPNGYRPNYNDDSQNYPGVYGMTQPNRGVYPKAVENPFMKSKPMRPGNSNTPRFPLENKAYSNGDHSSNFKHALRVGGPHFQPGPGSESDYPKGFHPKIAGGNMQKGLPFNNGQSRPPRMYSQFEGVGSGGPPPDWHNEGRSGWKPDNSWGSSRFRPPGEPAYQPPAGLEQSRMGLPLGPLKGKGGSRLHDSGANYTAISFPGQKLPDIDITQDQAGFKPRQRNLPTGYDLLQIAINKTKGEDKILRTAPIPTVLTTTIHPLTKEEKLQRLRKYDDFGAPIRWVPLTSQATSDGLAKVTDKDTHNNQQFVIEGVLYVPIVDESMDRLGLTTEALVEVTTAPPIVTPKNDSSIKIILRTMDLNKTSDTEWLAFETVLGSKRLYDYECDGDSCQSRCYKPSCGTTCKGDTCACGCVGVSCNAFCNGPGCFAMCIGEKCTAKCEGMNCESRCWGKGCIASCKLLSCSYTVNGNTLTTNATWDQLYPTYENSVEKEEPKAVAPEQSYDNLLQKNDYY